ncbi:MAG: hypothetical protein ACTHNU_12345 [Gaiellales bacterium]
MNDESHEDDGSVSGRVEDVARASAVLAARAAELEATRRRDEVRRAAWAGVGLAVLAVALITVFVFANWAAERALSSSLSGWRAPLLLAAVWLAVAVAAAIVVARLEPALFRRRPQPPDPAVALAEREAAFEAAQGELRESVEGLAGAIAKSAGKEIADAMVPDGIVDMGEDVMDVSDRALDKVDEVTDVIEARLPGGVVVNRVVDVALVPGRFGVRVARIVLSYGQPPDPSSHG